MVQYERIYLGHDNRIDLLLMAGDSVADIINTTRSTVEFGDTVIDSDTSPDAFDWSEGDGVLHLIMGDETIVVGSYKAVLTLYDVINTDGIVWGDFRCRVE